MQVQAIIFDRDIYTPNTSLKWVLSHGFKPMKAVHATQHYLRYRILDPARFKKRSFRTIPFGNSGDKGIKSIQGYLR